jgi:hypothetical protein
LTNAIAVLVVLIAAMAAPRGQAPQVRDLAELRTAPKGPLFDQVVIADQ